MASDKKTRAVPNSNPLGLTTREIEIAILAWRCLGDDGKIDKEKLATLAHLGNGDSAGRMFRGIKAKIIAALVDLSTPKTGDGGNDAAAAAAAAADPESPSLLASQKKKRKASGGKVASRKRAIKDADNGDNDGDGGERPSKIPKHVKGKSVFTLKKLEDAEGSADDLEAGEI